MSTTIDQQSQSNNSLPTSVDPGQSGSSKVTPGKKKTSKKRWNATMKLIRRVHLYSGLFMFPWVLLYGITGMFFNHPRSFSGGDVQTFVAAQVADGNLSQLSLPEDMAIKVIAAINTARDSSEGAEVVATDLRVPEYDRDFSFTVKTEKVSHTVSIHPITGDGVIRSIPVEDQPAPPKKLLEGVSRVDIDGNPMAVAQQTVPAVLKELGLPAGKATTGRRSPNLTFSAEIDGVPAVISYNMDNGSVSAIREDAESTMNTKSFFQRLHLSRGYSPHWNIKSFWGILVDLMFASMVFWGLSGLFMWWQIKRTRWLGGGFLFASIILAAFLCAGVYDNLIIAGSRRSTRGSKPTVSRSPTKESGKNSSTKGKSDGPSGKKGKSRRTLKSHGSQVKLPSR
ncbi:MAG: hypothetical protein QM501_13140 [Gimesia sp.]